MSEMVCDLDSVRADDDDVAGGKAAALGALRAAGFPVPDGFAVLPAACRAFFAGDDLVARVGERLAGAGGDGGLDQAAADIRVALAAAPTPADIDVAIAHAYLALAGIPERATVAVRPSVPGSDPSSRALVHACETFLCVHGVEAVLEAVRECWASLYCAAAVRARRRFGLPDQGPDIAVLVQRQVEATRAGTIVARGDEFLVEATYGLGEAASAGLVTPDRYVVARDDRRVLESVIHRKDVVVEARPPHRGTRIRHVDPDQAVYPALNPRQLRALADLAEHVEQELDGPQRIDWALDRTGTAWVVEATPVATPVADHAQLR